MNVSGLSFGGLASGLDTESVIQALLAVERRPVDLLELQKTQTQRRLDLFGTLDGKLRALQSTLSELDSAGSFGAHSATSSDPDSLGVTVTGTPATGRFSIDSIDQLATSTLVRSDGVSDPDASDNGDGFLRFSYGSGAPDFLAFDSSESSLNDLRDLINEADLDLRASIVFDGSEYYLEVVGTQTGEDQDFSVSVVGPSSLDFSKVRSAQDAELSINGLEIRSPDNSVEGAVEGLSLELKRTSDDPITVEVDVDPTQIEERLQSFVDAYNDVVDFLNEQSNSSGVAEDADRYPLAGDSTLRSLRLALGRVVASSVDDDDLDTYDSLAVLGIRSDRDGRLSIDSEDLQAALADDFAEVEQLFTDASSGLAQAFDAALDLYTDRIDGSIAVREEGLQSVLRRLDDSIERGNLRLEAVEQTLIQRFAGLETLMGRLQSQGNALLSLSL